MVEGAARRPNARRNCGSCLTWAVERSPFHAERLAGIDPLHFTEADLSSLPVMTKDDLMSDFSWVVTDPRLTLDVVEDHVEHVDERPLSVRSIPGGDVVRIRWPTRGVRLRLG